jgi:hypothetical protein
MEIEVVDPRNREENDETSDASNGSCAVPFRMSRERLGLYGLGPFDMCAPIKEERTKQAGN